MIDTSIYVFVGLICVAILYNFYNRQRILSSIVDAVSETEKLRRQSRAFLSTHNGKTPPTAAILSTLSLGTPVQRLSEEPVGAKPTTGYVHTFAATSAANIESYKQARLSLNTYADAKINYLEQFFNYSDVSIKNAALKAAFDIRSVSKLGDCSQSSCDFPCEFDCSFGDCGVCNGCGCSDVSCCPASPPGWPQRCGNDASSLCAAAVAFLGAFQAMCSTGATEAALTAICDAADAVPPIGAVCTLITGVGLPIVCEYNQSQLKQLISQGIGCTC